MLKKTQKLVWQVTDVTCDMCGQTCVKEHEQMEYGTLQANWGYYSDRDLVQEECDLCESCFGKVRQFIQDQGGTVRQNETRP